MKWILFTITAVGILGLSFITTNKFTAKSKSVKSFANTYSPYTVLELFTSEGCSSCPPADKLLSQLSKLDSTIIFLSFHVDYWNRLGWKDPFSQTEFSERQRSYGQQFNLESVYTPQVIVNGEYEMVGSNRNDIQSAIRKSSKGTAQVKVSLKEVMTDKDKIKFTAFVQGDFSNSYILAALVQKEAVVAVKAGENSGAKLTHINVVRVFKKEKAESSKEFSFSIPKDLSATNWQLVVYVQRHNLKITGAAVYKP